MITQETLLMNVGKASARRLLTSLHTEDRGGLLSSVASKPPPASDTTRLAMARSHFQESDLEKCFNTQLYGYYTDRFAEIGRLAVIKRGPMLGREVTILDLIDHTRCFIAGPLSDVWPQEIWTKHLYFTEFITPGVISNIKKRKLIQALEADDTIGKYRRTDHWYERWRRANEECLRDDFERFKYRLEEDKLKSSADAETTMQEALPALESPGNRVDYLIPVIFALASFVLLLMIFKKLVRFQKSQWKSRTPLMLQM